MAKLTNLPELAIIDGFKGTIDYYVHDGQPCARRWPRSPSAPRAPAVQAAWVAFSEATALWSILSPSIKEAYRQTAVTTNLTPRDLFTKSYITDYFRPGQWGTDYEASPPVGPFAILDIVITETDTGYQIVITTNNPSHLWMYYTLKEPDLHKRTIIFRGLSVPAASQYCFVTWHKNEQEEAGDTLIHTFIKEPWPICETRWFTFRGQIAGKWSKSVGPIFKWHSVVIPMMLILTEPWTVTTEPPPFTAIIEELWSELHTPPSWTEIINETWG